MHPSAWKKGYSRKFAVAINPSGAAACTRVRRGAAPLASKCGNYVPFVAPSWIKGLRLVTIQLLEKS
jgi:hypothetical protein